MGNGLLTGVLGAVPPFSEAHGTLPPPAAATVLVHLSLGDGRLRTHVYDTRRPTAR